MDDGAARDRVRGRGRRADRLAVPATRTPSRARPGCSASTTSARWRTPPRTSWPACATAGDFPPELAAPLLRATAALRALVTGGTAEPIADVLADLARARHARRPTPDSLPRRAPGAARAAAGAGSRSARPAAAAARPAAGARGAAGADGAEHAAGPGREDRPPARRGRRDHAVPGQAGALARRRRPGSPQDVADVLGAGERMLERAQGHRDRDADAPARGDHRAAAAHGPGPRPGRGQGGRVRRSRARTPSSTG